MKMRLLVFASVAIWVTALGWTSAAPRDRDDEADIPAAEAARVVQGYTIAPVPLNLRGRNPVLEGLGSYLVNAVGGCNDRRTNPPYKLAAIRRWASRNESTGSITWRVGLPSDRSSE